jgi:hypothetical protein
MSSEVGSVSVISADVGVVFRVMAFNIEEFPVINIGVDPQAILSQ